jgi:hypothetical protein
MPRKPNATVNLVYPVPDLGQSPPEGLGEQGKRLWLRINRDFRIDDAGLEAILEAACQATDLAAACAERIELDGLMVPTKDGLRDNPLIRQRIAALALSARLLVRLGCLDQPPRPVGRPGGR